MKRKLLASCAAAFLMLSQSGCAIPALALALPIGGSMAGNLAASNYVTGKRMDMANKERCDNLRVQLYASGYTLAETDELLRQPAAKCVEQGQ